MSRNRLLLALAAALAGACMRLASAPAWADPGSDESAEGLLERDYAAGLKAIEAGKWSDAIRLLSSAALRDTRNPDLQNYLGFAYRNAGDLSDAFLHYNRALELNPRHRGAHEYIGEAYLMVGNVAKAKEHLGALDKICFFGCSEYNDLKKAISEAEAKTVKQ